jgi:hypothetical protein
MNAAQRETIVNRLHNAAALLALWLVITSPWVSMLRRVPAGAGFIDYSHVALGVLALLVGIAYATVVVQGGRWKLYFPLAAGGGGLVGAIEGLLLLAFIAAGLSGTAWLLLQGSDAALAWRTVHIFFARVLIAAGVLHVLAVASHLLDFVRD